jgi:hypothetical protein
LLGRQQYLHISAGASMALNTLQESSLAVSGMTEATPRQYRDPNIVALADEMIVYININKSLTT